MQSCYSFLKRKQRPHSQAYVVCDDIIFSPNGRNRPDSMTIDWLGRAPVPHSAYSANKMHERPKRVGQPYDSHNEGKRDTSSQIITNKENNPPFHKNEVNSEHNNEIAASNPISSLRVQTQNLEQAAAGSEQGSSTPTREPNSRAKNKTNVPLRSTARKPEYRIEGLLFKPVSVSYNSVEISSRETTHHGNSTTVCLWDDHSGEVIVSGLLNRKESTDAEPSQLSTERTQCSTRPKPKVRILRMTSAPLPLSSSASQAQQRSEIDVQKNCRHDSRSAHEHQVATNHTINIETCRRSAIPHSNLENESDQNRDRSGRDLTSLRENVHESSLDSDSSSFTGNATSPQAPLTSRGTSRLPHGQCVAELSRGGHVSRPQHRKGFPPPSYNSIHRGGSTRSSWHHYLRPIFHAVSQRNRSGGEESNNSGSNRFLRFQRQQSTRHPSSSSNPSSSSGRNRIHSHRTATTHAHVTEMLARESGNESGANRSPCYRGDSHVPRSRQVTLPPYSAIPEYVSPPSYEQAMLC